MNKHLVLASISAMALSTFAKAPEKQPNIILIIADDLGYGDVSAYGSKTINTPNIDKLANNGVRFTNGYATSATSTPSRYGMFTGMYPWRNPDAQILPGDAPLLIKETQYTLPKMLQKEGYSTAAIGKWHLGMGAGNVNWNETIKPGAREIGFEYSNLIAATNDRVPNVYVENGNVVNLDPNDPIEVSYKKNFKGEPTALTHPELLKMKWSDGHNNSVHNGIPRIGFQRGGKSAMWVDEDMADYFTGLAKTFINDYKDKSFFLYFGLHQPHVPRTPHARFAGASGMGPRGDAIIEADWSVGEIMAELDRLGLTENTLVIFSSDNGPVLDDGYYDDAVEKLGNHKPAGALRGGKYSLFEAGTRVPFMVYWKGKIQPQVSDALVFQLDFMASIAALTGQKLGKGFDSQNTLPAFLGKSKKARTELVIEAQGRTALRMGDWTYIPEYKGRERNKTGNELANITGGGLFNIKEDIGQQNNLIQTNKKMATKLVKRHKKITGK
jgi:arylsulfatase A-like enzyme